MSTQLQPVQPVQSVQSVERAIAILRAIAAADDAGISATEVAARCALNRATAWRLLKTLQQLGMVDADPDTSRYRVGPAAVEIGAAGQGALVRAARPALEEASRLSGETASLAVVGPAGLAYVDEVAAPTMLSVSWAGRHVPVHATSTGKALLAWLPPADVRGLLASGLPRYTDTTITDLTELGLELAASRERGYTICRGECEVALYGVSAPILDLRERPVAVASLWGPRSRVQDRLDELGAIAAAAAAAISRARLGDWRLDPGR